MRISYVIKNANMYMCRMLFSQASDMAGGYGFLVIRLN